MKVGDKLPQVTFQTRVRDEAVGGPNPYRWEQLTTSDYFKGKRVVLFSLPGAFTPTCSTYQLPGFEAAAAEMAELGIDAIYCLSVNDSFVMNQWAKSQQLENVKVIPDGSGAFTDAVGMMVRKDNLGFGPRSWRYAAIIDDGILRGDVATIKRVGVLMVVVAVVNLVVSIGATFLASHISATAARDLRTRVHGRISAFSDPQVHSIGLSSLLTRSTGDVGQIQGFLFISLTVVVTAPLMLFGALVLSLALAQFLSKDFPGRKLVRLAILVPWAASVVMTTTIFYYMLDPDVGIANKFLVDIGLLDRGFGFTKQPTQAFIVAICVAVFVSIPFTTYTLLAGLQSIPADVVEAGAVDGASPWQRYRYIILPQLRPAIAVATIINIINVFNSLPILQVITGSIAGVCADTTTTLTFKLIRQSRQVDTAAAMSVLNFALILVIIVIYLKAIRPLSEDDR